MSEIVVAFDYGLARIGVATANVLTRTATPLTTLTARAGVPSWTELDRIVAEWRPGTFVVGLPAGPASEVRAGIASFVESLRDRYRLPIHTVDETLTSVAAAEHHRQRRRRGGRRAKKGDVDMHAACLIAEQWIGAAQ